MKKTDTEHLDLPRLHFAEINSKIHQEIDESVVRMETIRLWGFELLIKKSGKYYISETGKSVLSQIKEN